MGQEEEDPTMKRVFAPIVIIFIVLILGARISLAHRDDGPAYTVRQVQSGILRHPDRWLGRTVLVRGVVANEGLLYLPAATGVPARRYAIGAPGGVALSWSAQIVPTDLSEPVAPVAEAPLIVDQARQDDGWFGSLVRRLPLLDRLLPERGADGHHLATFRVALLDASADPGCTAPTCYHAVLQDPAPQL